MNWSVRYTNAPKGASWVTMEGTGTKAIAYGPSNRAWIDDDGIHSTPYDAIPPSVVRALIDDAIIGGDDRWVQAPAVDAANAVLDDIRSRLRIPDGTTVFDGLKAHVEMTSAAEDALSDVDGDSLANKAHNLRDRYRRLMDAQAQLHDRVEKVSRQLRQAQSELREAKSSHESRLSMIRHALEVDGDRPQLALMRAAMAIYEPLSDPDPL